MFDREEFERWRAEATRALEAADVQAKQGLHNWGCFVYEQAAQLAVKGLLHGMGKAPWGHDIVALVELLDEVGGAAAEDVSASARRLGRHYIPARYPDAYPSGAPGDHYGQSDSIEAARDAKTILDAVDALWRSLEG